MWESTLLVERYALHRELIENMLSDNQYQVFSQVMKDSNIPYSSGRRRMERSFRTFDSPEGLRTILERFPEIFAAILNAESFSSSIKDEDRGNLFNEYFPRIVIPTLTRIIVTSPLAEEVAREKYAPAFADSRTVYLAKPFVESDLLRKIRK